MSGQLERSNWPDFFLVYTAISFTASGKVEFMRVIPLILLLIALSGCGRYFHTPLQPSEQQGDGMTLNDDGSITFTRDRLSINLKPMTDDELNRLSAASADPSLNPYTFGTWKAPGDEHTPARFTVFRLKVNNYQYPKIQIDPLEASISTTNSRYYESLSYADLYNYYRAFWLGRTGQGRQAFQTRTDALKRTLYSDALIFSGNEEQGFLVFPTLHDDVRDIDVLIKNVALRFDYANEPIETLDLSFSFSRDILQGYSAAMAQPRN